MYSSEDLELFREVSAMKACFHNVLLRKCFKRFVMVSKCIKLNT